MSEQHAGGVSMRAFSTSEPGWQSSATGVPASGSSAAPRQMVAAARLSSSACTVLLRPSGSCSAVRMIVHAARRLYLNPAGMRWIMGLALAGSLHRALHCQCFLKSIQAHSPRVSCRAPDFTAKESLPRLGALHCAHTGVAGQHRRAPADAAPEGGRAACRGRQLSGGQLGRRRCRAQQHCITCSSSCRVRQQPV